MRKNSYKIFFLFISILYLFFSSVAFAKITGQGDLTVIVIPENSNLNMVQPAPVPPFSSKIPRPSRLLRSSTSIPSVLYFTNINDSTMGATSVLLNEKRKTKIEFTTISNLLAGNYSVTIKTLNPIKSTVCNDGNSLDYFIVSPYKKTTCIVYTRPAKIQVPIPTQPQPLQRQEIVAPRPFTNVQDLRPPPPPLPKPSLLPPPVKKEAPRLIEVLPRSVLFQEGAKTIALTFFNSTDRAISFNSSFGSYVLSPGETSTFELPQRTYEISVEGIADDRLVKINGKEVSFGYFIINSTQPTTVTISLSASKPASAPNLP